MKSSKKLSNQVHHPLAAFLDGLAQGLLQVVRLLKLIFLREGTNRVGAGRITPLV